MKKQTDMGTTALIRITILAVILAASPAQAQQVPPWPQGNVEPTLPAVRYKTPQGEELGLAPTMFDIQHQEFRRKLPQRCKTVRCRKA